MAADSPNLILEHLRAIRDELRDIREERGEQRGRLGSIERSVSQMAREMAEMSLRFDRTNGRLDRINIGAPEIKQFFYTKALVAGASTTVSSSASAAITRWYNDAKQYSGADSGTKYSQGKIIKTGKSGDYAWAYTMDTPNGRSCPKTSVDALLIGQRSGG